MVYMSIDRKIIRFTTHKTLFEREKHQLPFDPLSIEPHYIYKTKMPSLALHKTPILVG